MYEDLRPPPMLEEIEAIQDYYRQHGAWPATCAHCHTILTPEQINQNDNIYLCHYHMKKYGPKAGRADTSSDGRGVDHGH